MKPQIFRVATILKMCFVCFVVVFLSCIYTPEREITQHVSISIGPLDNGSCEVIVQGTIVVSRPLDTLINFGDSVIIRAIADSGFLFSNWSGVSTPLQNPLSFIAQKNTDIKVTFVKKPDKMIFVQSKGQTFTMGSDDPTLKDDFERPIHQVHFDYNFYLSATEVTVGEYRSLIPSFVSTFEDNIPVGNITWYDAVLYCNELSKRDGYDTVYTYTSICRSSDICPFILEDLKIHYDHTGYRLPSEAEWEYACRAHTTTETYWGAESADSFAWYSLNSSATSHLVGTKSPNPWGFYDMVGNVAEWVNDWLDYYDEILDTNPVGPTDLSQGQFESSLNRPIRGGSYRFGEYFLRTTVRKGPYETSAFISQEDIGFRVAFGPFAAQGHVKRDDSLKDSLGVTMVATKTDLINFIGTSSVKVAFVEYERLIRKLVIADYTGAGISIEYCGTDSSVYNPVISPDGKFVAYSSNSEGFGGVCSLTVMAIPKSGENSSIIRIPGTAPRWWTAPATNDTFLIYTTGSSLNSQPRWHNEQTMKLKMSGGKAVGAPEVVWAEGSYHGGMSADGRFIATGYPAARLVDLQINDTNIFYFWPPYNGRDDIPQTCNVSMSPSLSEPGEIMLLDFGYDRESTVVGRSYGLHEVIFVCNFKLMTKEHVSHWYTVPAPFSQWDYPEWSNHPDFASALARSADFIDNSIKIINCQTGAYQTVLSGQNVREMYLWIDPIKLPIVKDPYRFFGRYDLPVQANSQINLSKKLRTFWHFRDEWECAILGSSTAYYGFDPSVMSRKTINLGVHASNIMTAIALAEKYCFTLAPKLKVLVVDLMSYSFDTDSYKDNPRLTGLFDSKGFELDSSNIFYRDGVPSELEIKARSWGSSDWEGFDSLGFHKEVISPGWGRMIIDKGDYDFDDSVVQVSIAKLKNMSNEAAARQIHVLVVNTPQHPDYKTSDNMGRLGPSVDTFKKLVNALTSLERENPWFHYYDANNFGEHDYTDEDAYDANHLTQKGAAKLTSRVDSIINTYTIRKIGE